MTKDLIPGLPPEGQGLTALFAAHATSRKGQRHPIYRSWNHMKDRCLNPNSDYYHDYGGRGISVCEKWMRFNGFLEDMGASHKVGLTIDRIDNNGNYEPGNCRWADKKTQANNKRGNVAITVNGVTKNLAEWITIYGISRKTFHRRKSILGMSDVDALSTPRIETRRRRARSVHSLPTPP